MQCLTLPDSLSWLRQRGLPFKALPPDLPSGWTSVAGRPLGSIEAAHTFPIARSLASWFLIDEPPACLACVTQFSAWPSSENLALYYQWRRALGDSSLLDSHPGHLLLLHERSDLISLLQLALTFGWDISLFSAHANAHATLDHDGRFSLRASHKERLATVPDTLLR